MRIPSLKEYFLSHWTSQSSKCVLDIISSVASRIPESSSSNAINRTLHFCVEQIYWVAEYLKRELQPHRPYAIWGQSSTKIAVVMTCFELVTGMKKVGKS